VSPITHFLTSWLVANIGDLEVKEQAAITLAGVTPDLDGVGIVAEYLTRESDRPLEWYSNYHHVLGHNLVFGLLAAGAALAFSKRRWKTSALCFVSFHIHLLCDLAGSRGPDGFQWPIKYLFPLSSTFQLSWNGQWELNAWPNFALTAAALLLTLQLAFKRGRSPLAIFSRSADQAVVKALRDRFRKSV